MVAACFELAIIRAARPHHRREISASPPFIYHVGPKEEEDFWVEEREADPTGFGETYGRNAKF